MGSTVQPYSQDERRGEDGYLLASERKNNGFIRERKEGEHKKVSPNWRCGSQKETKGKKTRTPELHPLRPQQNKAGDGTENEFEPPETQKTAKIQGFCPAAEAPSWFLTLGETGTW